MPGGYERTCSVFLSASRRWIPSLAQSPFTLLLVLSFSPLLFNPSQVPTSENLDIREQNEPVYEMKIRGFGGRNEFQQIAVSILLSHPNCAETAEFYAKLELRNTADRIVDCIGIRCKLLNSVIVDCLTYEAGIFVAQAMADALSPKFLSIGIIDMSPSYTVAMEQKPHICFKVQVIILLHTMSSVNSIQAGNHFPTKQQQVKPPSTEDQLPGRIQLSLPEMSPRENAVSKIPDRGKRDEWSEGGVLSLLEAYESKWLLRNRAKLKGSDWEDIARQVSNQSGGNKTPNQCKNKIESMKKRYRMEPPGSSWQFYSHMDSLLKGTCNSQAKGDPISCMNGVIESDPQGFPKEEMDNPGHVLRHGIDAGKAQVCDDADVDAVGPLQESNGDDGSNTLPNNRKESRGTGSDLSTPKSKGPDAGDVHREQPFKLKKSSSSDVAESIRLLADSILKIEQARREMYKETECLRVEAEIKRSEMELKRTEIIANTQLQIVELLSRRTHSRNNESGGSSWRTETKISPSISKKADRRNEISIPVFFSQFQGDEFRGAKVSQTSGMFKAAHAVIIDTDLNRDYINEELGWVYVPSG
ncbi:hypothetical protein ACLOJK_030570 [Asimina triloba]